MYRLCGILILSSIAVIELAKCEKEQWRFLLPGTATTDDVKSLAKITSKQALPLVVFEKNEKLANPVALAVVKITNGRLASGTSFFMWGSSNQIFLCPSMNPSTKEVCLAPMRFEESQVLECEKEPMPILAKRARGSCGPKGTAAKLVFGYSVCPATENYTYKTRFIAVYWTCYDENDRKILFTEHMIDSAGLFSQELLIRERGLKIKEPEDEAYEEIPLEYFTNFDAVAEEKKQYNLQRLVPIGDFALVMNRKVTINEANYALQHKDLIDPWNEIRDHLRAYAEKWLVEPIVMTGVFDIPEGELSTSKETEMANIWVTLILDLKDKRNKGLAVLMNNFIVEETQDTEEANEVVEKENHYIDKICNDKNLCATSLTQLFDDVGGQVRCCEVTEAIFNLFLPKEKFFPMKGVLHIENIVA